jgi:hypothetical protein
MVMFFVGHCLIQRGICQIASQCGANRWVRLKTSPALQKSSRPAEAGQVIVVSQWKHSRRTVDSDRQVRPSLLVGLNPTPNSRPVSTADYFT